MVLLAVTAETWIVTGLGFGIVLVLLICLVFILQLLGWCMQKLLAPKAPKAPKAEQPKKKEVKVSPVPTDEGTMAAIAMCLSESSEDDMAAIAMALHLYGGKHDQPIGMIHLHPHSTAWNAKESEMNNKGF